ncbi:tail fiber assembly protein [Rosenbergiella metrosideri]|uniref:tail fiber assembly protein n=1 Tax=Rosenbergiella metrosideri TaxID=2921185 RepID=UPI001F502951|nr:tail fiber assembly protein [Rosenbergiella metrosideri]
MIEFSIEHRTFTVFHFDTGTKEYVGSEKVVIPPHTGLPANCCLVTPPKDKKDMVQIWDGKKWEYAEDYRGIVIYKKTSGQAEEFRALGPIPDDYVTEQPTSQFVIWENGKWVEDKDKKIAALTELAEQRKVSELNHANELIKPLEYADKLEIATENEKLNLKALMEHIVLISRINTSDPEKIEWPSLTLSE